MECPKCSNQQADGNTICSNCGIVFSKYYLYHPRPGNETQTDTQHQQQNDNADEYHVQMSIVTTLTFKQRLFLINENEDIITVSFRGLIFLGLLILSFKLITSTIASNYVGEIFLHNINLPFHEAGHVVFGFFGSFITSLGGSLGQLIMPAICFYAFFYQNLNPFAAAVCFWWVGENFLDIAPYINDARAGDLPLLGGNFGHSSPYGFHDWEYLLTESGLLRHDHTIANLSFFIGSVMMILALVWGGILLYRQYKVAISK
jgi:hypothetical protein